MIKVSASKTAESIRKAQLEIKRKLELMVGEFGSELSRQASFSTPVGDADRIAQGLEEDSNNTGSGNSYYNYYWRRNRDYGIEIAPGFHSGAYVYSNDQNIEFDPNILETQQMMQYVKSSANVMYNLGETFYIGASGPGYSALENGSSPKAPNGIMKPTLEAIELVYQMEIKRIYERA